MINWKTTKEDAQIIAKIAQRAKEIGAEAGIDSAWYLLDMDITACHCNGCPLKLQELLDACGFNFIHDVAGIMRHMDRTTGRLGGCFLPRYAK